MARPLKLPQHKIDEMQRRHLAGESLSDLAKSYGVGKTTVNRLVMERSKKQKRIAKQLATVELELEKLPISDRSNIRTITDQLKGMICNMADAGLSGSKSAMRLNRLAEKHSALIEGDRERINESATGEVTINQEALNDFMKLSLAAEKASSIPMSILNANKDNTKGYYEPEPDIDSKKIKNMTDEELLAIATGRN